MFVKFRIVFCKKYVNLIFSKVLLPCYEVKRKKNPVIQLSAELQNHRVNVS